MTKRQALGTLGLLAGTVAVFSTGVAHLFWGRGHKRQSLVILLGGLAADSIFLSSFLIPNFPLAGRSYHRGTKSENSVALSFDDGPRPPFTEQILDLLRDEEVPATFFVLGENALRYPYLVERMEREGHRVANHGMDHDILMWAGSKEARDQVQRAEASIRAAGVKDPAHLFRAPHGWLSLPAHRAICSLGYQVTGWTKGVWDTAGPGAQKIVSRTTSVLEPGSILLLHDGWPGSGTADRSQTVEALGAIVRHARARGLRFVTVEEMMQEKEAKD